MSPKFGLLLSSLITILMTIISLIPQVNRLLLNPIFLSMFGILVILLLIWYFVNASSKYRDEQILELDKIRKAIGFLRRDVEDYKNKFEEKFIIHDRLNKLEFEVSDGKKKSRR